MEQEEIQKIIELRKKRKNYRQIGLETGYSAEWVGRVIAEHAPLLKGDLLYPELDKKETFEKPDEIIASELNLPVSSVASARRRINRGNKLSLNLARRRRSLSKTLFNYLPGEKFITFLRESLFAELTPLQRGLMESFYINPKEESLAIVNNFDTNRGYRTEIKVQLIDRAKEFDTKKLLKEGALKNGRSGSKSN
jgi:hypothetical protein